MLTRRTRPVVSPSLVLDEPEAVVERASPSLMQFPRAMDNHFRPVSPSLCIPELMPSPCASPCASPSLGLIPQEAMRRATEAPAVVPEPVRADRSGRVSKSAARMTTAVCKRASRMARPSEPSEAALVAAERLVNEAEEAMRLDGLVRRSTDDTYVFKHTAPSTGKGPAVRAGSGDGEGDAAAQAMMNHVRKAPFFALLFHPHSLAYMRHCLLLSLRVSQDGLDQEPPRRHQQPGALVAHRCAQHVPAHVRQTGCERDQEVRTPFLASTSQHPA